MHIKKLHPDIAAEVRGVDIGSGIDITTALDIKKALLEHLVLIFPSQVVSESAQEEFCRHFGDLELVRSALSQDKEHPSVLLITNVSNTGKTTALEDGEMMFHYDQCYYPNPCLGSTLYALEVPRHGGNTLFANGFAAYERLPNEWKKRIEGLNAIHYYSYASDPTQRPETLKPDAPQCSHAIVRKHPESGKKCLFVNRLMTIRVEGLKDLESDKILSYLFSVLEDPEHIYEHVWTKGDLIMWDNRSSAHARTFFAPNERRMMRRVTIKDSLHRN